MPTKSVGFLTVFSLACLLSSCKQIDDMETMNSNTTKISQTSDRLEDKTTQVLAVSNELRRNTSDLYHQARSKEAQETRQRSRDALRYETSFEEKVTHASVYFKSFEFQLWTNGHASLRDNETFRAELMLEAVEEYFRTIQSFYEEVGADHEISPASTNNGARALFALAVTLHETHAEQKRVVATDEVTEVTMLSIIEETLQKASLLEQGLIALGDLMPYEIALLENEESARNMLRMRFDILSAMALSKVSRINDPNQGTVAALTTQARLSLKKWDSRFNDLNLAQKHQVETFLGEAIRVKEVLKSLGENSALESKVANIYANMRLPKANACGSEACRQHDNGLGTHREQLQQLGAR